MTTPRPAATTVLVIGMAGSGKTTFMQRMVAYAAEQGRAPYVVNLDPAVAVEERAEAEAPAGGGGGGGDNGNEAAADDEGFNGLPYLPNIDIRDSVDYQAVMRMHKLGPNGAIMTCLNMFASRFDGVVGLLEEKRDIVDYVLVDTPGQIEVFTWSASGSIITDAIASVGPTVLAFVVDTPRTTAPATFCSNMLYACSVMLRTKLPMVVVFNKTDVQSHEFALHWMEDFSRFQEALDAVDEREEGEYMSSLNRSMALVLEEFYHNLETVGVSSYTGQGMDDFFSAVDRSVEEYKAVYLPEVEARRRDKKVEMGHALR